MCVACPDERFENPIFVPRMEPRVTMFNITYRYIDVRPVQIIRIHRNGIVTVVKVVDHPRLK